MLTSVNADLVGGLFMLVLGSVLALLRRRVGESIVRTNNAAWGFAWGDREAKLGEGLAGVGGAVMALFGLLKMCGLD